jgi:hypothetical protein
MAFNVVLALAQRVVTHFWESREVKELVVSLLDRYAKSTDNDVDDILVNVVRGKLLKP